MAKSQLVLQHLPSVHPYTVRIILTNFTTYVKILFNVSRFYNDLDRQLNIPFTYEKTITSMGFELATLGFEVRYLTTELRSFACKSNKIVDLELGGVGLKLDNFHNFMNAYM